MNKFFNSFHYLFFTKYKYKYWAFVSFVCLVFFSSLYFFCLLIHSRYNKASAISTNFFYFYFLCFAVLSNCVDKFINVSFILNIFISVFHSVLIFSFSCWAIVFSAFISIQIPGIFTAENHSQTKSR